MDFYSTLWTQFETQSLAFAILRKQLYPKYIVRGYSGQIVIFRPTNDKFKPEKVLTIHVTASDKKSQTGIFQKNENEVLLVGGDAAYQAVDLLKKYLPE